MFGIMLAALVGGPLTTVMLWDSGAVIALAAALFGGSVAGLVTAGLISGLRPREPADTIRHPTASPWPAARSSKSRA
jgi:hypothetical protein